MSTARHPIARALSAVAAAFAIVWVAGFLWFVKDALRPAPDLPVTDGIVALTGGADRVATAISLLRQNRARVLLISGVGPNTAEQALFRGTGIDPAALGDRITLGRWATDTLGNAEETAAWAQANDVHSLIVVTAGYHMQRALTELARTLPDVTFYPAPVVPPALRGGTQLSTLRLPTLRLLAGEYTKWLAAELGLTRLQRVRDSG
jgi:uncharacterized SAM-binding protein YcdF (DUF218 family)